MESVYTFVEQYFFVYIWLIAMGLIDTVAPVSASTITNPVTAFFTDPQRAIGISTLLFFLTSIYRVFLFKKEIFHDKHNFGVLKSMLPFTIIGAIAGGLTISHINTNILVVIIVSISIYYIYKNINQIINNTIVEKKIGGFSSISVATLSGFFQASGMPGGDIKRGYLRTVLPEVSVRAVSYALGMFNFFIGGSIIFLSNKLPTSDLIFIVTILPPAVLALKYGKLILEKISDRNAKILATALSIIGVVLLTYKYLL